MRDGKDTDGAERPETKPQRKRLRRPRKATPDYLERAALWYLERYASTSANLRRVLCRKVDRSAQEHATDPQDGRRAVDELIDRFQRAGLLDDRRFAEARARSLHERGISPRGIRTRLKAKGVPAAIAEDAIDELETQLGALEEQAALRYARRRRIGAFRVANKRADYRERDLASLARAGFTLGIARTIVDAENETDAIERLGLEAV